MVPILAAAKASSAMSAGTSRRVGSIEAIAELVERLNSRPFVKLEGTRRSRFEAIDRPAMRPLPAERYVLARRKKEEGEGRSLVDPPARPVTRRSTSPRGYKSRGPRGPGAARSESPDRFVGGAAMLYSAPNKGSARGERRLSFVALLLREPVESRIASSSKCAPASICSMRCLARSVSSGKKRRADRDA